MITVAFHEPPHKFTSETGAWLGQIEIFMLQQSQGPGKTTSAMNNWIVLFPFLTLNGKSIDCTVVTPLTWRENVDSGNIPFE